MQKLRQSRWQPELEQALTLHRALIPFTVARDTRVRADAFRLLRHVLVEPASVVEFGRDRGLLALVRALEREGKFLWERTQAMKLAQHVLHSAPGHVPRALVRSFVVLAAQAGDTFQAMAMAQLRWAAASGYPSLLGVLSSSNGIKTMLDAALAPGAVQGQAEGIWLTLAHVLNHSANHAFVPPTEVVHAATAVFTGQLPASTRVGWSKLQRVAEAAAAEDATAQMPFWTTRGLPSGAITAGRNKAARFQTGSPPCAYEPPSVQACREMAVARAGIVTLGRTWAGLLALTDAPFGISALISMLHHPVHPRVLLAALRCLAELLAPPRRDAWSAVTHAGAITQRQRMRVRRALRWHMERQAPAGKGAPWDVGAQHGDRTLEPSDGSDAAGSQSDGSSTSARERADSYDSGDSRDSASSMRGAAAVPRPQAAPFSVPGRGNQLNKTEHRALADLRGSVPGFVGAAVDGDTDGSRGPLPTADFGQHLASGTLQGASSRAATMAAKSTESAPTVDAGEYLFDSDSDGTVLDYFMGLGAEADATVPENASIMNKQGRGPSAGSGRQLSSSGQVPGGSLPVPPPVSGPPPAPDAVPELDAECTAAYWVGFASSSGAAAVCRQDLPAVLHDLESGSALSRNWWREQGGGANGGDFSLCMPTAVAVAALSSPTVPLPVSASGTLSTSHALDSYTAMVLTALLRCGLLQPLSLLTTHHDAMLSLAASSLLTTVLSMTMQLLPQEYAMHILSMPDLVQLAAAAESHVPLQTPAAAAAAGSSAFQAAAAHSAAVREQFLAMTSFVQACHVTAFAGRQLLSSGAVPAAPGGPGLAPLRVAAKWPWPGDVPLDWRLTPVTAQWPVVTAMLYSALGGRNSAGGGDAAAPAATPLDHLIAAEALEAGAGQIAGFGFPGRRAMRGVLAFGGSDILTEQLATLGGTPYIDPDVDVLAFDAGAQLPGVDDEGPELAAAISKYMHHGLHANNSRSIMAEGGPLVTLKGIGGVAPTSHRSRNVLAMGPRYEGEGSMLFTEVSDSDEDAGPCTPADMWRGVEVWGGGLVAPDELEGNAGDIEAELELARGQFDDSDSEDDYFDESVGVGLSRGASMLRRRSSESGSRRASMVGRHSSISGLASGEINAAATSRRSSLSMAAQGQLQPGADGRSPLPGSPGHTGPDPAIHSAEHVLQTALAHAAVTVPRIASLFGMPQYPGARPHPHTQAAAALGILPHTYPFRDGNPPVPTSLSSLPSALHGAADLSWSPLNRLVQRGGGVVDRHFVAGAQGIAAAARPSASHSGPRGNFHQNATGIIAPAQGAIRGSRAARVLHALVGHAASVLARWNGELQTSSAGGSGFGDTMVSGGPFAMLQHVTAPKSARQDPGSDASKAPPASTFAQRAVAGAAALTLQGASPAVTHTPQGAIVSTRLGLASAAALYSGGSIARHVSGPSDQEVYDVLVTASRNSRGGAGGVSEARIAGSHLQARTGEDAAESEDEDANDWSAWGALDSDSEGSDVFGYEDDLNTHRDIASDTDSPGRVSDVEHGTPPLDAAATPNRVARAMQSISQVSPELRGVSAVRGSNKPARPASTMSPLLLPAHAIDQGIVAYLTEPIQLRIRAGLQRGVDAAKGGGQKQKHRGKSFASDSSGASESAHGAASAAAAAAPARRGSDSAEERIIVATRLERLARGRGVFVNMNGASGSVGLHFPVAITSTATPLLSPERLYPCDYDTTLTGQGRLPGDSELWTSAVAAAVTAVADLHDPATKFHAVSLASLSSALGTAILPLNEIGEPAVFPGVCLWRNTGSAAVAPAGAHPHPVAACVQGTPLGGAFAHLGHMGIAQVHLEGYRQRVSTRRLLRELKMSSFVASSSGAGGDGKAAASGRGARATAMLGMGKAATDDAEADPVNVDVFPRRLRSAYEVAPAKWTPPAPGAATTSGMHRSRVVRRLGSRPRPLARQLGGAAPCIAAEKEALFGASTRAALAAVPPGEQPEHEKALRRIVRRHRRIGVENGLAFLGESSPSGAIAAMRNTGQGAGLDIGAAPSDVLVFDGGLAAGFSSALQSTLAVGGSEAGSMLLQLPTTGGSNAGIQRFRGILLAVQRCAVLDGVAEDGDAPVEWWSDEGTPELHAAPSPRGATGIDEEDGTLVMPLTPQESMSTVIGGDDDPWLGAQEAMDTLVGAAHADAPGTLRVLPAASERLLEAGKSAHVRSLGYKFAIPRSMLAMTPLLLASYRHEAPAAMNDADLPMPPSSSTHLPTAHVYAAEAYTDEPLGNPSLLAMAAARDMVNRLRNKGGRPSAANVSLIPYPAPLPHNTQSTAGIRGQGYQGAGISQQAVFARVAHGAAARAVAGALGLLGPQAHVRGGEEAAAAAARAPWTYWGPGHGYTLGEIHTRSNRTPLLVAPRGAGVALDDGQGVEDLSDVKTQSERSTRPVLNKWSAASQWRREAAVETLLRRAAGAVAATGIIETMDWRLWDWGAIGDVLDTHATSPEVLSVLLGGTVHARAKRRGGSVSSAGAAGGSAQWETYEADDKLLAALGGGRFMTRLASFFTLHMDWLGGLLARQRSDARNKARWSSQMSARNRAATAELLGSARRASTAAPRESVSGTNPTAHEPTATGSSGEQQRKQTFFRGVTGMFSATAEAGNPFEEAGALGPRGFVDMPWSPSALRFLRAARQWLLLMLMHPVGRELLLQPADDAVKLKDVAKDRATHGYTRGDARRFLCQLVASLQYEANNTHNTSNAKPMTLLDDTQTEPGVTSGAGRGKKRVSMVQSLVGKRGGQDAAQAEAQYEDMAEEACPSPFAWDRMSLSAGRELLALLGVLTSCPEGRAVLRELEKAGFDMAMQQEQLPADAGAAGNLDAVSEDVGAAAAGAGGSDDEGAFTQDAPTRRSGAAGPARMVSGPAGRSRRSMTSGELATYETRALKGFRRKTMRGSVAVDGEEGGSGHTSGASTPPEGAHRAGDAAAPAGRVSHSTRPGQVRLSTAASTSGSVASTSGGESMRGRVPSMSALPSGGAVFTPGRSSALSNASSVATRSRTGTVGGFLSHFARGDVSGTISSRNTLTAPRDADAIARILLPSARHPSKDYLNRAILSHVDYDRQGSAGRLLISTWVASRLPSMSLRLYCIQYTRVLLRQGTPGWSGWVVDTLVTAMHLGHEEPRLTSVAVSVLSEAASTGEVYRRAIVARRPPVEKLDFTEVYPLLMQLVAEPEGMLLVAHCGLMGRLMQSWLARDHVLAAAQLDAELAAALASDEAWVKMASEMPKAREATDAAAASVQRDELAARAAHMAVSQATAGAHGSKAHKASPGTVGVPPASDDADLPVRKHAAILGAYPRNHQGVAFTPAGSSMPCNKPEPEVPHAVHKPLVTPIILPSTAAGQSGSTSVRGDGVDWWSAHALPWRVEVWAEWTRGTEGAAAGAGEKSAVRLRFQTDTMLDASKYHPERSSVPGNADTGEVVVRAVVCDSDGAPSPVEVPPHAKLYAALFVGPHAIDHTSGDIPFAPGVAKAPLHIKVSKLAAAQAGAEWVTAGVTWENVDARLHSWRRRVGATRASPFKRVGDEAVDVDAKDVVAASQRGGMRALGGGKGGQKAGFFSRMLGSTRKVGSDADASAQTVAQAAALSDAGGDVPSSRASEGWRADTTGDVEMELYDLARSGNVATNTSGRTLLLPKGAASVLGVGAAMGADGLPIFHPPKPLTAAAAAARLDKRITALQKAVVNASAALTCPVRLRSAHEWAAGSGLLGMATAPVPALNGSAGGPMAGAGALSGYSLAPAAAANIVAQAAFRLALWRHLVADTNSEAIIAALSGLAAPRLVLDSLADRQLVKALRASMGTYTIPEQILTRFSSMEATRSAASNASVTAQWMVCPAQGAVPEVLSLQSPRPSARPVAVDDTDLLPEAHSAADEYGRIAEALWGHEMSHECGASQQPDLMFARVPLGSHCAYNFTTSKLSPGSIRVHSVEFPVRFVGNLAASPMPECTGGRTTVERTAPSSVAGIGYTPLPKNLYTEMCKHAVGRRTLLASGHLVALISRMCDAAVPPMARRAAILTLANIGSSAAGYSLICDRIAPDFTVRLDAVARGHEGDLRLKAQFAQARQQPNAAQSNGKAFHGSRAERVAGASGVTTQQNLALDFGSLEGAGVYASLRGTALLAMSIMACHTRARLDFAALGWIRVQGGDLPFAPMVPSPASVTLDDVFLLKPVPRADCAYGSKTSKRIQWFTDAAKKDSSTVLSSQGVQLCDWQAISEALVDPHAGFTHGADIGLPTRQCEKAMDIIAAFANRIALKDAKPALAAVRRDQPRLFSLPSMMLRTHRTLASFPHPLNVRRMVHSLFDGVSLSERYWQSTLAVARIEACQE